MDWKDKVIVITGANRGLGLETARQLVPTGAKLILGCRDLEKAQSAQAELKALGGNCDWVTLDVSDQKTVTQLGEHLKTEYGGQVDSLVNNAGIFPESWESTSALTTSPDTVMHAFETNTVGPYRMCQLILPLMSARKFGRVVNVSSGMGALSEGGTRFPAYRFSKTALNSLTVCLASEFKSQGILINSVCPGWVRTDMGGSSAARSLEEGADTLVWAATLPEGGPSGGFFRDRKPIDW